MSGVREVRSMQEFHERYFPDTLFEGDLVRDTFTGREGRIKAIVGKVAVVRSRAVSLDPWTADIPLSSLERVPIAASSEGNKQ